jgi:cytochrome c-type biogenesis protein CcmH/NrfG
VRLARGLFLAAALALAFAPELPRYRAERILHQSTNALRYLVTHPTEFADPRKALENIEQAADYAAAGLPGDSRPWILAGSSRLVASNADGALELYRRALALGERAEIDLNMGRAWETRGDSPRATAAYLRAVWIAPALFPALLPDVQASLHAQYDLLEDELRGGRLRSPPALP